MEPDIRPQRHFIHAELMRRALFAVEKLPELWRRDGRIQACMLLWPEDHVRTSTGKEHSGVVFAELPDEGSRLTFLQKASDRCGAYALLIVEQLPDCIRAVFESVHGTETWRLPLKDHGGVKVLGAAVHKSNAESIGVLWHAN